MTFAYAIPEQRLRVARVVNRSSEASGLQVTDGVKPTGEEARLNREYVPHIAAYAVLEAGYDATRCAFSCYRTFRRDLLAKRAGTSFETGVEFYDPDGPTYLQIEAKASSRLSEAVIPLRRIRVRLGCAAPQGYRLS